VDGACRSVDAPGDGDAPDESAPEGADADGELGGEAEAEGAGEEGGAEVDDGGADDGPADDGGGPTIAGPRDLFDIEALQALPLRDDDPSTDDLCWTQESEATDPGTGVTETVGTWCGGRFDTFEHADRGGDPATIDLAERAAIYWPPGYPDTAAGRAGFGHVYAAHEAGAVRSEHGGLLALGSGMPVLQHGDATDYLGLLGIAGRGEMTDASGPNLLRVNPCTVVDLTRGNFGWALARVNVRAITLLQRLAALRAGAVAHVALMGGSKEGFATWLASAVDDRIEVDRSGGYQREDPRTAYPFYGADWGCAAPPAAADVDVVGTLLMADWIARTPAGQAAERAFSVALFQDDLYPRLVLVGGDVTRFGMHDSHHYPLGSETPFLDGLAARPFRYDRRPNTTRETDEDKELRQRAVLLEQLVEGPGHIDLVYPKVTSAVAEEDGRGFRVRATASPAPEAVRLWWSHSDDRVWNDEENAEWAEVPMTLAGAEWVSPTVDASAWPADEVAWYVEAETTLVMATYRFARRDCSPVRFLWRLPEVGCAVDPPDWCGP
jgi:hypothetical protein